MEKQKRTPITGKEGSPIELELAASWTKNYRDKHPGETISQFFGKEILEKILSQEHCLGIRFYYALDREGKKHLIITGAMSDGTDQIEGHTKAHAPAAKEGAAPKLMAGTAPVVYTVGEMSSPCPGSPGCPTNVLTGAQ